MAMPGDASAATYTSATYNSVASRVQALLVELEDLVRQLARLQGQCGYYGTCGQSWTPAQSDLSRIDVELFDDYAEVTIRYRDGDEDDFLFDADSREEVIEYLIDETGHSRSQILAVTRFDQSDDDDDYNDIDDIRRIDVDIRSGDAYVDVRYEDGDRDDFVIENETRKSDIIDEIADELDLDDDDVEDLIRWDDEDTNDDEDIESIDVTIYEDDEDARARVEYEDGDIKTYSFNSDDEDEIIEELADLLDMDEDDIEDLTDFDYED